MPASAAGHERPPASAAPEIAPLIARAARPGGSVRSGVDGSLSTISSPRAIGVVSATAGVVPSIASGESFRSIQPSLAAQLAVTSGALVRGPAVAPSRKAMASVRRESATGRVTIATRRAFAWRITAAPARASPKSRRKQRRAASVNAP